MSYNFSPIGDFPTREKILELQNAINAKDRGIIGEIKAVMCSANYTPEGCLPCDGSEYNAALFPVLWEQYLIATPKKLLTCTYSEFNDEVSTKGFCGKFGVSNNTFKTPLLRDGTFISNAKQDSELGKGYTAGLPNIKGRFNRHSSYGIIVQENDSTAPFYFDTTTASTRRSVATSSSDFTVADLGFDASLSSPIYGNSNTVTPDSIRLRYFVVVATSEINTVFIDWNNYMSALSGKLNVDMSNSTTPYIIDSYTTTDNLTWYRRWSNGMLEQCGFGNIGSNGASLTYPQPFTDTEYFISGSCLFSTEGRYATVKTKSLTQSTWYTGDDDTFNASDIMYYAWGRG